MNKYTDPLYEQCKQAGMDIHQANYAIALAMYETKPDREAKAILTQAGDSMLEWAAKRLEETDQEKWNAVKSIWKRPEARKRLLDLSLMLKVEDPEWISPSELPNKS